jgi:2-haloalkanoic acid dehalogenase type II
MKEVLCEMYKAVFLDYYGTLVEEDDLFIEEICNKIRLSTSMQATSEEIGRYWWGFISRAFRTSHGEGFKTQRELELLSLKETINFFHSSESPKKLSEILFKYWRTPVLYEDTIIFMENNNSPKIIVSNIDRNDIQSAISHNKLHLEQVITSEDVRSYKPRSEIFRTALKTFNLRPEEVLHVGDSLSNDVAGAQGVGIKVAWINRRDKKLPHHYSPDFIIHSLTELIPLLK